MFKDPLNYQHFLLLYEKYVEPIADTFAWCLMPNHFHFLIRILDPDRVPYPFKDVTDPSRAFSHLCNAYAQAFNKRYERTGGLFKTPFQRKIVETDDYFRQLVFYIHNNPVKHGFTTDMLDYPWSSFKTFITIRDFGPENNQLTGWFSTRADFIEYHHEKHDVKEIFQLTFE
jgi:REP element-mobilizing transposase RayT